MEFSEYLHNEIGWPIGPFLRHPVYGLNDFRVRVFDQTNQLTVEVTGLEQVRNHVRTADANDSSVVVWRRH